MGLPHQTTKRGFPGSGYVRYDRPIRNAYLYSERKNREGASKKNICDGRTTECRPPPLANHAERCEHGPTNQLTPEYVASG